MSKETKKTKKTGAPSKSGARSKSTDHGTLAGPVGAEELSKSGAASKSAESSNSIDLSKTAEASKAGERAPKAAEHSQSAEPSKPASPSDASENRALVSVDGHHPELLNPSAALPPLDVEAQFRGKNLVVIGCTGFLGKVWVSMLLEHYPDIGHLWIMVRSRKDQSSEERFWSQIAGSEVFEGMRKRMGDEGFQAFMLSKITPIDGDVSAPLCGIDLELLDGLEGRIDAVVNVAGVVDFSPPLDEALEVNAFGVQNLVSLGRKLGQVPVLHTSTCYVAGNRSGMVEEINPLDFPFPRADELDLSFWDPDREISEGMDIVRQARQRVDDAFRQTLFLDEAKANLRRLNEPSTGKVLEEEIKKVRRRFVERQLVDAGTERAQFWGWPNIYTYTKALGEQILARSGLPFTIVRPSIIESSLYYPFPGWNEGINTTAPLMYGIVQGLVQIPTGERTILDVIPVDFVASGMLLALAELLEGNAKPVYQCASGDVNGPPLKRLVELTGLFKRRHYDEKGSGNPILNFVQKHIEAVSVSPETFDRIGSPGIGRSALALSDAIRKLTPGPAAKLTRPLSKGLEGYGKVAERSGRLISIFLPFLTGDYVYSTQSTRSAFARAMPADQEKLPFRPELIDWRHYWMEVHGPGLDKWVFPEIKKKEKRELKAARRHETLVALLDDMAERHEHAVALQRLEGEGLTRITFLEWQSRSEAVAARLALLGVKKGDPVFLSAQNHPDWPIAYFGILKAGAVAVPVDATLDPLPFSNVLASSKAKVALWCPKVEHDVGEAARAANPEVTVYDLHAFSEEDESLEAPKVEVTASDLASLIFTSGTTGTPKGVMLSHANFTSLLGALMPVFPLTHRDRVLSVLPLHHTFEFTCGLLLPLSCGARIIYLDELNAERLSLGLEEGRVTAMVGVPALWQLLERRILSQAEEAGFAAEKYLEWGGELVRWGSKNLGVDIGKTLFAPIHQKLGGNIRYLVSGGAALPEGTQKFFSGLGLHLAEGYGLTEAAPVLTVRAASPKAKLGSVGKALPGVEIVIRNPDANGVGEVLARGPNVMLGYAGNEEATREAIDAEGWLHTGDLGKLDRHGALSIVGRAKEVIVSASGENVYPDDVENLLGDLDGVEELAIVGIDDPRGGERVAMLARPVPAKEGEGDDAAARVQKANQAIRSAVEKLPLNQRPVVIHLYDAELPKTATRKVRRSEVRKIIDRMESTASAASDLSAGEASSPLRAAVASLARRKPEEISATTRFQADLGFDSLMMMELVLAVEQQLGGKISPEDLARAESVGDAERLLSSDPQRSRKRKVEEKKDEEVIRFPEPVRAAVKSVLGRGQRAFYEHAMETRVTGRAHIPHNRNVIVVANHASHLDMGLVKTALGDYGNNLVSLAAQDYFFSNRARRTWFENFSNLAALDRKSGIARSLRQAGEILEQGKTVLIFPEGTRSPSGEIQEFKRSVAHLALTHGVDILPIYLKGTYDALPRGSSVPTKRKLSAHIGPVLRIEDFERLCVGMKLPEKARAITRLSQRAVEALRDGSLLDLSTLEELEPLALEAPKTHPLVALFKELEERFQQGAVDEPVSFYFTLGPDPEAKWSCVVDSSKCSIVMGRPAGGEADCVLKTSPAIFTRIVREAYVPGIDEFLSGAVKSNDVALLGTFQKAFGLS